MTGLGRASHVQYKGRSMKWGDWQKLRRQQMIDEAVRRKMWEPYRQTFRSLANVPINWRPPAGTLAWYWIAEVRREFARISAGDA